MVSYRLRGLIIIPILFILVFSSIRVNADWNFQPYGDKIYYSTDRSIVLIAPDNAYNISVGSTYQYTLFDSYNGRNITVSYNNTIIIYKMLSEKAVIGNFYVNDTLFDINVKDNNSVVLLSVHFIAIGGGWIPIDRNAFPRIPRAPFLPPITQKLDIVEVINAFLDFTFLSILLSTIGIYIMGLFIKYFKEHKTTEGEYIAQKKYYEFYHKRKRL